jgi:hypothetical protein
MLMALSAWAGAPEPEGKGITGRVSAVTLYRGQALVTRVVPVEGGAGPVELVVGNLPEQIVPDSLFAEGTAGLAVRAVRMRTRSVGEEPREEVRKIDQEIELIQDKIAQNKRVQQVTTQRGAYLDKLETFVAPTATAEMTKGVLNVATLKDLSLFSFEQRQTAAQELLKLETEAREMAKQLSVAQRRRGELTSGATRTVREALVFLDRAGVEKGEVKLSYLVKQAGWAPAYNFRAAKDGKEIAIEYNALIQQMSGEDWTGVALTLSTASPALTARAPGLAPFRVALGKGARTYDVADLTVDIKNFRGRQQAAISNFNYVRSVTADNEPEIGNVHEWDLNAAVNDFQRLELTATGEALRVLRAEPAAETPSVSHLLPNPVSLTSRSDQQMLRIEEMKLPSTFYHVATPILASYVYREAELSQTGAEALLGGPVTVYLDGRFVGHAALPTIARGQSFVMGFGTDPQLRARRELVDKTEAVQGGNRELAFKYRLVIENYKDTPVKVRLLDRIPVSEREGDVRVTLGEMKDKLSEDKVYLRIERPKGILRWEIDVPGKAFGDQARLLEYGYKMEFDRNLGIATPGEGPGGAAAPAAKREFKELQERRMSH